MSLSSALLSMDGRLLVHRRIRMDIPVHAYVYIYEYVCICRYGGVDACLSD